LFFLQDKLNITVIFIGSHFNLQKANYENREQKQITDEEFLGLINIDKEMGLDKIKSFVLANPDHCKIIHNYKNDSDYLVNEVKKVIQSYN